MSLLNILQAASNAVAGNVAGPVDLLALGLRGIGVPVGDAPVGGTEWMRRRGLIRDVPQGASQVVGETLGLLGPIAAAAKAPQIAQGLLAAERNAAAPRALNTQKGAIVWHGSPHKFDRFDSSKIGTGEGAQAYGHGLYLAESRKVADEYAGKLASELTLEFPNKPSSKAQQRIVEEWTRNVSGLKSTQYGSRQAALSELYNKLTNPELRFDYTKPITKYVKAPNGKTYASTQYAALPEIEIARRVEIRDALKALGMPEITDSGNLYKVDLPDDMIARMLDWDKPLSQQAPEVQEAIEALRPQMAPAWQKAINPKTTGQSLNIAAGSGSNKSASAALLLRQAGIPGIRYLDGGSRGAGVGTSNFVVFPGEESALRILERNGMGLLGQ